MIVTLPSNNGIFFTKDKDRTEIECLPDSYIQINIKIKRFRYHNGTEWDVFERTYKLSPFQGKTSVFLGDIAEPYFYVPKKLIEIFDFSHLKKSLQVIEMYKPLEMELVFQERNFQTDTLIDEYSQTLHFIHGKMQGIDYSGRVGSRSFYSYPFSLDQNVSSAFSFAGELGSVNLLENASGDSVGSKMSVPAGIDSLYILWLDDNLSLQIFEFTGRYKVKNTYEAVQAESMLSGHEIKRNIDSLAGKELTVNTGFIFKSDIALVESILKSKKAWISFDLQKFVSFVSNTKELEYESTQQLYYFDLEFALNSELVENHGGDSEDPDYDLVFGYSTDASDYYFNFWGVFGSDLSKVTEIDWGDGTVSSGSVYSHIYADFKEYEIKVKVPGLEFFRPENKNVTYISKFPSSLKVLIADHCMLSLDAVKTVLSRAVKNKSTGDITDLIYFSHVLSMANQRPNIILDQPAIDMAVSLQKRYWRVSYGVNNDGKCTRYITPEGAATVYPVITQKLTLLNQIEGYVNTVYARADFDILWENIITSGGGDNFTYKRLYLVKENVRTLLWQSPYELPINKSLKYTAKINEPGTYDIEAYHIDDSSGTDTMTGIKESLTLTVIDSIGFNLLFQSQNGSTWGLSIPEDLRKSAVKMFVNVMDYQNDHLQYNLKQYITVRLIESFVGSIINSYDDKNAPLSGYYDFSEALKYSEPCIAVGVGWSPILPLLFCKLKFTVVLVFEDGAKLESDIKYFETE